MRLGGGRGGETAGALLPLLLLAACTPAIQPTPTSPPPAAGAWERYGAAVQAARRPRPEAISTRLVPLVEATEGLAWNEAGEVLMVTWTEASRVPAVPGEAWLLEHEAWLTPVPQLARFCRRLGLTGRALERRLAQYLGLPPDTDHDSFAEVWVDPAAVFRPCPDPEVTDRECQMGLTADGGEPRGCPWQASLDHQVSGTFIRVTRDHLEWMCENWERSYPPGDVRGSYPWTGLGYTHDWGNPDDPVGASEYVAPPGAVLRLHALVPTATYCAGPRGAAPGGDRADDARTSRP